MMTDSELEAAENACNDATAGPWVRIPYGGSWRERKEALAIGRMKDPATEAIGSECPASQYAQIMMGYGVKPADIEFIVTARQWLPRLLAEVRQLRRKQEDAVSILKPS